MIPQWKTSRPQTSRSSSKWSWHISAADSDQLDEGSQSDAHNSSRQLTDISTSIFQSAEEDRVAISAADYSAAIGEQLHAQVSKQEPSTSAFANNKQVRIQESEPEFPSSSADVLDQAESQLLPLQDTGIPTRTPEEDAILSPSIQTSSATRSTSMHEGTTKEVVSRNPNISLTTLAEAGVMPFTLEIAENVQDISSEAFKTEDGSLEEPADMEMPAASQAIEEQYIGDVGNTPLLPYSPEDLWRVAKTGENNASSSHTTVEASKIRRRSSTRSRMSSRPVTRKPSSAPSTAAPADDHAPVPSCCVRSKPSRRQRLVRKSRYVVMCKPFLKLTLGRDLAQSTQMKLRDAALGEL